MIHPRRDMQQDFRTQPEPVVARQQQRAQPFRAWRATGFAG
jgi:hypothetical protein